MITEDPETLLFLLKYNEDRFHNKDYLKYIDKVEKYLSNNKKVIKNNNLYVPSINNGFTLINYEKIKNIIILLCKKGIYKTKLLKELFYCDFLNYKKNGYSLTGLEYARLPFGPVPVDYENILYSLLENNNLELITEVIDDYEKNYLKSAKQCPNDFFTTDELEVINKVINKFEKFTVKQIEEYSHNELSWLEIKTGEIISYEYSFDINL